MNIISNTMKRTLSIMFNPQRRARRFIIDIITSYFWFFYASLKVLRIAKKNTFSNTHIIVIVDQNIRQQKQQFLYTCAKVNYTTYLIFRVYSLWNLCSQFSFELIDRKKSTQSKHKKLQKDIDERYLLLLLTLIQ